MTPVVEELLVRDARAWSRWLERNAGATQAWLVLARKGTSSPTRLTHPEALEVAICFGWIDGQRRARDDVTFLQRFSPRRPRSPWSQINVAAAEQLIVEGSMRPAGLAEVERAKADGRWASAYAGQATIEVPADVAAALAADAAAAAMFGRLSSQNRYAILYRVGAAKRADTRVRRIAQYVAMLARGETIYPQRGIPDG
jgi:uncharacterized protein YdeI (YjbR/CyaY-like superfamily)